MTKTRHTTLTCFALIALLMTMAPGRVNAKPHQKTSGSASVSDPAITQPYRMLVNRYCVVCHNGTLKTAGLLLDQANLDQLTSNPAVWEKVIWRLRTATMPPVGMPRPRPTDAMTFASWLETSL